MKYASIVPLIGGETIAMQNVFGKLPEYILSYKAFEANDMQLVEYYRGEVPYHLLDEYRVLPVNVDVVNTVCPCAGLSSLSPSASSDNAANDWMIESANYVLNQIQPKVFWGENAPRLASKMGEPVVERLRQVGEEAGYTFTIYKTMSKLHGLSQVRDRTFYFFWKGEKAPVLEYINRVPENIEDTIRSVGRNPDDPMDVLTNDQVPSHNPFYKYVLEEIEGGITHQEFASKIEKTTNPQDYIEERNIPYSKVSEWMKSKGFDRDAAKAERMHAKLKSGGNIMRKMTTIPKGLIGAFVGHMPTALTHPDEDRYLTIREAMEIMKLPRDFVLQGGRKNLNMICQNVPVTTAEDMASQVKAFVEGRLDNKMIETKYLVQDNRKQSYSYEKNSLQLDQFMV